MKTKLTWKEFHAEMAAAGAILSQGGKHKVWRFNGQVIMSHSAKPHGPPRPWMVKRVRAVIKR